MPAEGNKGSGEILALGHLFGELAERLELQPREKMALINGSPCASALVADIALAGRGRLALAERALALSAEAIRAPLERPALVAEHPLLRRHVTVQSAPAGAPTPAVTGRVSLPP